MLVVLNLKAIVGEGIYSCANPKQESPSSQFNINSSNFNKMIFNHNPKWLGLEATQYQRLKECVPSSIRRGRKDSRPQWLFHGVACTAFAWTFLIEVAKEYAEEWTQISFSWQQIPSPEASNKGKALWFEEHTDAMLHHNLCAPTDTCVPVSSLQFLQCGEPLHTSWMENTRPTDKSFFSCYPPFALLFSSKFPFPKDKFPLASAPLKVSKTRAYFLLCFRGPLLWLLNSPSSGKPDYSPRDR